MIDDDAESRSRVYDGDAHGCGCRGAGSQQLARWHLGAAACVETPSDAGIDQARLLGGRGES